MFCHYVQMFFVLTVVWRLSKLCGLCFLTVLQDQCREQQRAERNDQQVTQVSSLLSSPCLPSTSSLPHLSSFLLGDPLPFICSVFLLSSLLLSSPLPAVLLVSPRLLLPSHFPSTYLSSFTSHRSPSPHSFPPSLLSSLSPLLPSLHFSPHFSTLLLSSPSLLLFSPFLWNPVQTIDLLNSDNHIALPSTLTLATLITVICTT